MSSLVGKLERRAWPLSHQAAVRAALNSGPGLPERLSSRNRKRPQIFLSRLASLTKQPMDLVLRRTSRRRRSMALVVRGIFQWALGSFVGTLDIL